MGPAPDTQHDASAAGTRSSGYAASLLLMQLKVSVSSVTTNTAWSRTNSSNTNPSRTNSSSKAGGESADPHPVVLESSGPKKGETVATPSVDPEAVRCRASSDGANCAHPQEYVFDSDRARWVPVGKEDPRVCSVP